MRAALAAARSSTPWRFRSHRQGGPLRVVRPHVAASVAFCFGVCAVASSGSSDDDALKGFAQDAQDVAWAELSAWLEDFCGVPIVGRFYTAEFDRRGQRVAGLGTLVPVQRGERFACVPQRCWVTIPEVQIKEAMRSDSRCHGSSVDMAIYMALEVRKGNASVYAPYLRSLPTQADYERFHPAYSRGEVGFHPAGDVWYAPEGLYHQAMKCYALYLHGTAAAPPSFEEVFLNLVRIHSWRFEGSELVPLVEKANTAGAAELNAEPAPVFDDGELTYCLQASRDISAGEEILADYQFQDLSALTFFTIFGFTLGADEHADEDEDEDDEDEDLCLNLGPDELPKPGDGEESWLHNVWRFAEEYCHDPKQAKPKGRRGGAGA